MSPKKRWKDLLKTVSNFIVSSSVKRIHIVDLIGAKAKETRELDYIKTLRGLTISQLK